MRRTLEALVKMRSRKQPLSGPLSEVSTEHRETATELSKEFGSRQHSPPEQVDRQARTLWLISKGLLQHTVNDRSPRQRSLQSLLDVLAIEGLAVRDMGERVRFLTCFTLFAPLIDIHGLAQSWLQAEGEERLIPANLRNSFEITPAEYRIPLLGFYDMLGSNPDLYLRAADSLWSRRLTIETWDRDPEWRASAHRFRYLVLAGEDLADDRRKIETLADGDLADDNKITERPTARLQLERLEKVLSRLFLKQPPSEASTGEALKALLQDLNMGWVFGSGKPPESFHRAWAAAQRDAAESHPDTVPWEGLVILTLAIDGRLLEPRLALLQEAWQRQVLDLELLVEYMALRLGGGGFDAWKVPPHEEPLANFVSWTGRLLAGEQPDSKERRCFIGKLAGPLFSWTAARQAQSLRRALVDGLSAVVALDPQELGPRLRQWIDAERSQGRTGLAELAALVPAGGRWLLDEAELHPLFAELVEDAPTLSLSLRNWLLHWASYGVFEEANLKLLGQLFARSLARESRGGSLGWLSLAAPIRRQPDLRQAVELELKRQRPEQPATLFEFVKLALKPILDVLRTHLEDSDAEGVESVEDYASKVAAYHPYFTPFATDLDAEFLDGVLGPVKPEESYTREGTAGFLAALVKRAPKSLRAERGSDWQRDLARLIEHGATAEGTLGRLVGLLSTETVEALEDNLVALAVRRAELNDVRPVKWIATTLIEAPPDALPALEEGLVELVTSPSLTVAEASLTAILGPVKKAIPDFLEHHRRRLRRVVAVVKRRGGYRPKSRFAARMLDLRKWLDT